MGKTKAKAPSGPRVVVRAHAVPVQRVVSVPDGVELAENDPTGWWAFCDAVQECWRESALLASWGCRKLVQAEPEMPFADGFARKAPKLQLYSLAFVKKRYPHRDWWKGMTQSACSVLRRVEKVYGKTRFEQFGCMNRSHVSFKFPQPFPFHNAAWKITGRDERGLVTVSLALPGGRWELALRGGPEFGRQLAALKAVERGEAKAGEAILIGQSAPGGGGGRPVFDARHPGGGRRQHWRIMFKAVVTTPSPAAAETADTNTMALSCDPNAFWVAQVQGRQPFILNADHVKRWAAAHRCYLQRFAEDTKYEKRWPAEVRRQMNEARERRCDKHHNRIKSWQQMAAAQIANYAARCRCAKVIYDGAAGAGYLPSYPWRSQQDALGLALAAKGIALVLAAKPNQGADDGE